MSRNTFLRIVTGSLLTLALMLSVAVSARASDDVRILKIRDDCDPATFNLALNNPNACIGNGDTTFAEFIQELTADMSVDEWRYTPNRSKVRTGDAIVLENRGGETHTFTKVAEFGGGFVPQLNTLAGNLTPRPECAQVLENGNLAPQPPSATNMFVKAGTTRQGPVAGSENLPEGVNKFQCCIHPWMHVTVTVREKQEESH
jgi:plastocyanin